MVDPRAEVAQRRDGVAAADDEVPRVEAELRVGEVQHAFDLPRRLDEGARLVVERRLVAAVAAAVQDPGDSGGEAPPAVVVETPGAARGRAPRPGPALRAAGVGEGGGRRGGPGARPAGARG